MSLQNLLKKLAKIFTKENIEELVINNFREIMLTISGLGLIVIIIIIFIITGSKSKINKKDTIIDKENVQIDKKIETSYVDAKLLITPEYFIIPSLKSFDVTSDYENFLPIKQYKLPEMNVIVDNYEKIFYDTIEESCKFNFEKRIGRGK